MIRLIVLLALLFPSHAVADFGVAGGQIGNIYVYGDSYVDAEEIWTHSLNGTSIERTQFWTAATGGARAEHNDTTGTFGCGASAPSGYEFCKGFIEKQVLHLDGSCRVDYSTAGGGANLDEKTGPTCIADRDIGPNDICVLSTGTNDVNQGSPVSWDGIYGPGAEAAVLRILDEFDRVGCPTVVSSSVPLIRGPSSNFWRPDLAIDAETNAASFSAWMKNEVETNRPNMVFVDLRAAWDEIETTHGEEAFLSLYNCRGGKGSTFSSGNDSDPTLCGDGVHPDYRVGVLGYSGRELQASLMGQAILRLRDRIRMAPIWIGN